MTPVFRDPSVVEYKFRVKRTKLITRTRPGGELLPNQRSYRPHHTVYTFPHRVGSFELFAKPIVVTFLALGVLRKGKFKFPARARVSIGAAFGRVDYCNGGYR